MLGKLIDGRLVIAGQIVKDGNTTITNPTEEKLKELGYKTIEYTEKPTFNKEEEKLQEIYTDGETITVSYEVVALTKEEKIAVLQSEIIAEENKMTARNIRGALLDINFDKNKIVEIENNIAELRAKIREITNEE
jgi:hypothetical protein